MVHDQFTVRTDTKEKSRARQENDLSRLKILIETLNRKFNSQFDHSVLGVALLGSVLRIEGFLGAHPTSTGQEFLALIVVEFDLEGKDHLRADSGLFCVFQLGSAAKTDDVQIEPALGGFPVSPGDRAPAGQFVSEGVAQTRFQPGLGAGVLNPGHIEAGDVLRQDIGCLGRELVSTSRQTEKQEHKPAAQQEGFTEQC